MFGFRKAGLIVLKPKQCQAIEGVVSEVVAICGWLWKGQWYFVAGHTHVAFTGVSKCKKWQLALIITNPYQDGGKYSTWYGWCTRPFFPVIV